jgi:hypothetical protein
MTGGITFEITDPDLTVLGRSSVELVLSPSNEGEQEAVINLLHIIWIEVLSANS